MNVATPDLKVKLFADGADKAAMLQLYRNPLIKGFTTNPTLMRKAGIVDYEAFARDILCEIHDRPISLEVFADEFDEMERQARLIATWGPNVYVKIPVTNTKREPAFDLIDRLSHEGIRLNITAILTLEQVRNVVAALAGGEGLCAVFSSGKGGSVAISLPCQPAGLGFQFTSPSSVPWNNRRYAFGSLRYTSTLGPYRVLSSLPETARRLSRMASASSRRAG